MAFTGRHERMPAARAYQLGIISQVVDPPENLRAEAAALAEKIAKNSPTAMADHQASALASARTEPARRVRGRRRSAARRCGAIADQEEGPLSFAEKREAAWVSLDESSES